MKIKEYEKELKEINPHLNIKISPQAQDVSGINYDDCFICTIPSGDIFEETKLDYKDAMGCVHRTKPVADALVKRFLENLQEELELDKEVKELTKKK